MIAGTIILSGARTSGSHFFCHDFCNYELPRHKALDCVPVRSLGIYQHFKKPCFLHYFVTADDAPEALAKLLTSGFYAKDTSALRARGHSPSSHPAPTPRKRPLSRKMSETSSRSLSTSLELEKRSPFPTSAPRATYARQYGSFSFRSKTSRVRSAPFLKTHKDRLMMPLRTFKIRTVSG